MSSWLKINLLVMQLQAILNVLLTQVNVHKQVGLGLSFGIMASLAIILCIMSQEMFMFCLVYVRLFLANLSVHRDYSY